MENTYGLIYCIENTINGHKYIGQTIRTFEERISEHFRTVNAKSHQNRALYQAIKKYGKENFRSLILDTANSQEELDQKETYWIEYYDTFQGSGYNMTSGGQDEKSNKDNEGKLRVISNKEFMVFDLNGNYLFERKSHTAFAKEIGCEHGSIGGVLRGRKATVKGYILIHKHEFTLEKLNSIKDRVKRYGETKPDFVIFRTDNSEILGIWNSIIECQDDLGWNKRSISNSLNLKDIDSHHKRRHFKARYVSDLNELELFKFNKYKEELNNYETKNITRNR